MSSQLQVSGEAKIRDIQGPVVANSGVITALDGAASQYVRGDGTLADFPTSTGGGSSVSYYLNSSVSQGTIGGVAYRELSKEPIIGAGTDIAISANGYVASYITDANDPDVLSVPGGNFNCEFYFSVNNNTGSPTTYAELYKYDGTTFTLLGSSVGVPESINQGTTIAPYYFAIPVATAALALTDRLAIRIYVSVDGRTVTLHTENSHLCQVVTTFSKGMVSLNNLTDQSQFITTGTSGTDFNIVSSGDTHTFNIPSASASNRGLITTGNQTIAGIKTFNANVQIANSLLLNNSPAILGASNYGALSYAKLSTESRLYITDESNFSSILSFTNTADYTYTFPATSGTLALTSNLSSYVPYTGATADVNLGSFSLSAAATSSNIVFANGSGSSSGMIYLKKGIIAANYTGYNGIYATSTSYGLIADTGSAYKLGLFSLASLTDNTARTFTLPDLSGTLALLEGTQTFSGSKTFSGGASFTLAGGIVGFSGGVAIDKGTAITKGSTPASFSPSSSTLYSALGDNNLIIRDSTNTSTLQFQASGSNTYTFPAASGTLALTSNLSDYLPLTGGTLTGNLTINPSTTDYTLTVSTSSTNNTIKLLGSTASNTSTIGYWSSNGGTGYGALNFTPTNTRFEIVNGGSFSIYTSGNERLTIASTGAVNLGTNELTSGNVKINDTLYLKVATIYAHVSGYYGIQVGTNLFTINNSASTQAAFSLASLTTSRTFTLPDASGTLALTNQIPANPVGGTGTTNYLPKFTGASTIGNSNLINDASGNLGLGVTPSASSDSAMQSRFGIYIGNDEINVMNNAYFNSGFKYVQTGFFANRYYQNGYNGGHQWLIAPSGTAGNAITFTQAMTLASTGNLLVGTTTDAGYKLDVNGTGRFSSNLTANTFVEIVGDLRFNSTSADRSIYFRGSAGAVDGNWKMGNYLTPAGATVVNLAATVIDVFNGAGYGFMVRNTSNAPLLQIAGNTGAATFSSSVTASGNVRLLGDSYVFGTDTSSSTTLRAGIRFNSTDQELKFFTSDLGRLTIASTGAATFSSSVTAAGTMSLDNDGTYGGGYKMLAFTGNANGSHRIFAGTADDMYFAAATSRGFEFRPNGGTTAAMRITSGGNVGIGTSSPTYQLQLSTDSAAKPTSALWTIASDKRIKENINHYNKGLQELLKINPVTYDYNGLGGFAKGKGGVGIIAQEIIDILPDSVSSIKGKLNETDEEEIDILNFNGHELIYVLINATKEQQAQIEELKAENKLQNTQVKQQSVKITKLEELISKRIK